jgi:predicted Zn-dependent peptidase
VDSRGLDQTVEILGEVVLRPLFTKEELDTCQMIIRSISFKFTTNKK